MDNKKISGLKKAVSVALMGAVCLTAATAVAMTSKTVKITDGEKNCYYQYHEFRYRIYP